jgi:D-alanyl-D-alanine carboxypeptidase (penicillin-binding protein 5/6)
MKLRSHTLATVRWLLLAAATAGFDASIAQAADIQLAAQAAVLMEARTGRILWQRNQDAHRAPASTTKILTALVVIEKNKLDEVVSVPRQAVSAEGATIPLQNGERLTVEQLLYALLLGSANDAALALAQHAGGSIARFVELMNATARSLGAQRSEFRNPTGLPQKGHLTTARDLATITRGALGKAEFRNIVSRKTEPWKSAAAQGALKNSNRLLEIYPGAIGVKTGQTKEAGFCLVASAARGERTLIAVMLKSTEKAIWDDATKLLDYGFENFRVQNSTFKSTP